jgi:hypothetical protein
MAILVGVRMTSEDEKFFSKPVRAKVRNVWQHRFVVSNLLGSHLVGALVIIGGIEAIEFVLTHGKPFKVFESLPIEFQINWLFNASDIGVIVVFLFRGVVAMWRAEGDG